jgi:hypothetical protein
MDKTPDLGLPFFYRVILPGTVVTIAAFPLFSALLSSLGVEGKDQAPYLIGIGIVLGFVLSLLDDPIYQILEGRTAWPRWLASWRSTRWKDLVRAKMVRQDGLNEEDSEYRECWYLLRQFPVDAQGNPTVTQPSRIGNVIAAYEQYPEIRYGMDSVFYWPRLWLLVDKDIREEIDNPWAAVDAILYAGFGVAVVGITYIALGVVTLIGTAIGVPGIAIGESAWFVVAGLALLLGFLACIQISVPGLVANGETFKSVFDLYRAKLILNPATAEEKEAWTNVRDQLQYGVDNKPGSAK